jgi:diadenosine tetraphosphatase ApaH/serine/threonine PP2A family protein phosphatase
LYGFYEEIMLNYSDQLVWDGFQLLFAQLPLAAVVADKILCVHGGLSPDLTSLDQISEIALPFSTYDDSPMIADLVWSDPEESIPTFAENPHRGSGVFFGPEATNTFLDGVGLKLLIRAHQCVVDGFQTFADNAGITVFSSSNYCRKMRNKGAVIYVKNHEKIEIYSFSRATAEGEPECLLAGEMVVGNDIGLKAATARGCAEDRQEREPEWVISAPVRTKAQCLVSKRFSVFTPKRQMGIRPRRTSAPKNTKTLNVMARIC